MVTWQDMQRPLGHAFYDRLDEVLGAAAGVDRFVEEVRAPFYAAMRDIVRRETGESCVETPTDDELGRLDRGRKAKKVGNAEWTSPSDPEARITWMKDGRTRLAYKPEHAVDLDSAVFAITPDTSPLSTGC